MPLADITNPEYMKFFVETCEKTAKLRYRWNLLNKERLQETATLHREDKGITDIDVLKVPMLGGLDAVSRDHVSSGYNRRRTPIFDTKTIPGISSMRKEHSIPAVGLGDPKEDPKLGRPDTDLSLDPIMRPVDPKQMKILYKSKPVFGRQVYLKNRSRLKPEDRYYFAESSAWEYGWRLRDTPLGVSGTRCGKVYRLTRDGMSRSGPQPDPDHYKEPIV